jgi:hypothetical protein
VALLRWNEDQLASGDLSILALTMANPMTILSFGALFAGLGVTSGATGDAALVVLGVLLGSTTWWVVLTTVIATLRTRVTPAWIHRSTSGRRDHQGVRDRPRSRRSSSRRASPRRAAAHPRTA